MGRRIRIKQKNPNSGFPYEPGDEPVVEDHVADAWVEYGLAEEIVGRRRPRVETAEAAGPPENAAERTRPPGPRPTRYEKRSRSPGWYDVYAVNEGGEAVGEPVNDSALRKDDADELVAEMEGGG